MKLEIPGWRRNLGGTGDELSFREAMAEPARVMELELPQRFRIRARISGFAGFEYCQNSERGAFFCVIGFYEPATAGEWRFQDVARHAYASSSKASRFLNSRSIAKSDPNSFTFPRPRALASPVLGKRTYRDEVKLRFNRQGMALRERSARYYDPAISQHLKISPLKFQILKVQSFREPCAWQAEIPRIKSPRYGASRKKRAVRADACDLGAALPRQRVCSYLGLGGPYI